MLTSFEEKRAFTKLHKNHALRNTIRFKICMIVKLNTKVWSFGNHICTQAALISVKHKGWWLLGGGF
jgi:hypothetical protein